MLQRWEIDPKRARSVKGNRRKKDRKNKTPTTGRSGLCPRRARAGVPTERQRGRQRVEMNNAEADKKACASEASATALPEGNGANPSRARGKPEPRERASRAWRGADRTQAKRSADEYGLRNGAGQPPARQPPQGASDPRSGQKAPNSR